MKRQYRSCLHQRWVCCNWVKLNWNNVLFSNFQWSKVTEQRVHPCFVSIPQMHLQIKVTNNLIKKNCSDTDAYMANVWRLNIYSPLAPRLVSWDRGEVCPVIVARMWLVVLYWFGLVYLFIHWVAHVTLDTSITVYILYSYTRITTQLIIYGRRPNII
jgi:hypothetical protein